MIEVHEIEEIKSMLYPHIGHLKFLTKIKVQGVSMHDISNIIEYIKKNPHIIKSLPKDLHSYKSYYSLIKDIHYTESNYELIRFIKNNLSRSSREIVLSAINEDDSIRNKFDKVLKNEKLKESFIRWSSKINSREYLYRYIEVIIDSGVDFKIESRSNIRKLTDYDIDRDYIPMSWCIRRRETFNNYLRSYDIFLINKDGSLFGVNLNKNTTKVQSVIDENNNNVYDYKYFQNEVNKYFIFGGEYRTSKEKKKVIEGAKKQSFYNKIKHSIISVINKIS